VFFVSGEIEIEHGLLGVEPVGLVAVVVGEVLEPSLLGLHKKPVLLLLQGCFVLLVDEAACFCPLDGLLDVLVVLIAKHDLLFNEQFLGETVLLGLLGLPGLLGGVLGVSFFGLLALVRLLRGRPAGVVVEVVGEREPAILLLLLLAEPLACPLARGGQLTSVQKDEVSELERGGIKVF